MEKYTLSVGTPHFLLNRCTISKELKVTEVTFTSSRRRRLQTGTASSWEKAAFKHCDVRAPWWCSGEHRGDTGYLGADTGRPRGKEQGGARAGCSSLVRSTWAPSSLPQQLSAAKEASQAALQSQASWSLWKPHSGSALSGPWVCLSLCPSPLPPALLLFSLPLALSNRWIKS